MIRKATLAQLPQILELYAAAREFMAKNANPNQWGTADPPEDQIRRDIAEGKCYVNLEGDALRAVFYFALEQDPTYCCIEGAWPNNAPYGVIHRIAAGEKGRGVAAECFDFALTHCDNLRMDTHEDNLPMQRCLAKYGFVRCGIIYVADGTPRIAYQKIKE